MAHIRLLKVVVQPTFVIDDGETLKELQVQAVQVSAADWPTFPESGYRELLVEVERQINT